MRLILLCLPVRKQILLERELKWVILISPLLCSVLLANRCSKTVLFVLKHTQRSRELAEKHSQDCENSVFLNSFRLGFSFNSYFERVLKWHHIASPLESPWVINIVTAKKSQPWLLYYCEQCRKSIIIDCSWKQWF